MMLRRAVQLVLVAAAYFVAGKLGLRLAFIHSSASPVWPPTGIALAAMILLGRGVWPAVFAGAFLVNVTTAGSVATSLGIAAGNTLEGVVGSLLVTRFAGGAAVFERPRELFRFAGLIAPAATALSATIGVTSLCLGGFALWNSFGFIWFTWWLGDMGGALVVAPFLVLAARSKWRVAPQRLPELMGLAAALLVVGQAEFGGWLPGGYDDYPLGFLCLPFLLWAAFRFGPSEAAAALVFLSGMAVWGTLHGFGPFVGRSPNESLLLLESFLAVTSVTTLGVAAVVRQQRQAEAEILELNRGLERRVQERTAELAQSNADLEAFTSSVSHDLRAPVRHIREFSRLVLDRQGFRNMDEVKEAMEAIHDGALQMGQLIDDLLRLSRVGRLPLERVPVDMGALVDDAASEFREQPGRDIRWEIGAFGAWRCDPGLARVAVRNLVENAVKFTRPREQAVIRIGETTVEGQPVLFVSDNGVGFPMSQAPRLFRVFQRLHSDFEGSGVGLATVQAIVQKHGGRIWATSAPDEGATFYFTFGAE